MSGNFLSITAFVSGRPVPRGRNQRRREQSGTLVVNGAQTARYIMSDDCVGGAAGVYEGETEEFPDQEQEPEDFVVAPSLPIRKKISMNTLHVPQPRFTDRKIERITFPQQHLPTTHQSRDYTTEKMNNHRRNRLKRALDQQRMANATADVVPAKKMAASTTQGTSSLASRIVRPQDKVHITPPDDASCSSTSLNSTISVDRQRMPPGRLTIPSRLIERLAGKPALNPRVSTEKRRITMEPVVEKNISSAEKPRITRDDRSVKNTEPTISTDKTKRLNDPPLAKTPNSVGSSEKTKVTMDTSVVKNTNPVRTAVKTRITIEAPSVKENNLVISAERKRITMEHPIAKNTKPGIHTETKVLSNPPVAKNSKRLVSLEKPKITTDPPSAKNHAPVVFSEKPKIILNSPPVITYNPGTSSVTTKITTDPLLASNQKHGPSTEKRKIIMGPSPVKIHKSGSSAEKTKSISNASPVVNCNPEASTEKGKTPVDSLLGKSQSVEKTPRADKEFSNSLKSRPETEKQNHVEKKQGEAMPESSRHTNELMTSKPNTNTERTPNHLDLQMLRTETLETITTENFDELFSKTYKYEPIPVKVGRFEDETIVVFSKRCAFSNSYACKMITEHGNFNSALHYYVYRKTSMFGDEKACERIRNAKSFMDILAVSENLPNYDERAWRKNGYKFLAEANMYKFRENPLLRLELFRTLDCVIVEAHPNSHWWGVGLNWESPYIFDKKRWKGDNVMGHLLMAIRDCLAVKSELAHEVALAKRMSYLHKCHN